MDTKPTNHQRIGSVSNSDVGNEFERLAQDFFKADGLRLTREYSLSIGVKNIKKAYRFDLGSLTKKVIVECKSHTWTESGNTPGAKMTTWNQAMYYFSLAPSNYRKIMFVLKDYNAKRKITLANYYVKTYPHLIPKGVEIWEYSVPDNKAEKVY